LIPWSKISEVAVSEGTVFGREQYLQLAVEWKSGCYFPCTAGFAGPREKRSGRPVPQG